MSIVMAAERAGSCFKSALSQEVDAQAPGSLGTQKGETGETTARKLTESDLRHNPKIASSAPN